MAETDTLQINQDPQGRPAVIDTSFQEAITSVDNEGLAELEATLDAAEAADQALQPGGTQGPAASEELFTGELTSATPGSEAGPGPEPAPSKPETQPVTDPEADAILEKETEAGAQEDPSKKPPQTPYDRARARQGKSWERINETKAALEKREEAIVTREREIAEGESERLRSRQRAEQMDRLADDKDQEARKHEEAGDDSAANRARGVAEMAREQAQTLRGASGPVTQADIRRQIQTQREAAQRESWQEIKTEVPEVVKAGSELNTAARELFEKHPSLFDSAAAPAVVVRLLKERGEAGSVPALQEKITKLEARNQELEALVAPGGGGGAVPLIQEAKPFEQWSDAEQKAWVDQQMAASA